MRRKYPILVPFGWLVGWLVVPRNCIRVVETETGLLHAKKTYKERRRFTDTRTLTSIYQPPGVAANKFFSVKTKSPGRRLLVLFALELGERPVLLFVAKRR